MPSHHASVLFNGNVRRARAIGADGLHLNSRELHAHQTRPLSASHLLAASCHDAEDLVQAARWGPTLLLSPVLPTRSHPDAEPLGWDRFCRPGRRSEHAGVRTRRDAAGAARYRLAAWRTGVAGIRGLWLMTRQAGYWIFSSSSRSGLALSWGQIGRKTHRVFEAEPFVFRAESSCRPRALPWPRWPAKPRRLLGQSRAVSMPAPDCRGNG